MPSFARICRRRWVHSILHLRNRHFFALDLLAFSAIPAVALTLRLDRLDWWPQMGPALILFTAMSLAIKVAVFFRLGLYRRYWRHAGLDELTLLLVAVGSTTVILAVLCIGTHALLKRHDLAMYRTVPVIDGLLTVLAAGGFRFGVRGLYLWYRRHRGVIGGRRVLVVGAGEAGMIVVQELRANPQLEMEPVGFVDDDPAKAGTQIQGLPVLGTCAQIPELVQRDQIQRIVVAMPSAPFGRLQGIVAACKNTGVATYSLPGMYELLAGHKTVSRLPQIDISQLLRRQPVRIDEAEVAACLADATVLVTGAGGSIGRELCRQIARFNPAEIVLLGHGENSIFEINLDLRLSFPSLLMRPVIADVRDRGRVSWVVEKYRPDVIFHAAAHKHVPLMEANVEEAITNNVLGTQNVLRAAEQNGVERFVLISTDKAVNPHSVMGATKRLAELLVVAAAQRSGRAYMAVRFGNVLGSRGSVIPVFQEQIAAGGPLTVTHREMCRYFMTIPEAVQLVLQAAELGQGGEVFVLDMGEPVRIVDLATDLIRLAGLEPGRDIEIVFTGLRPGEKLTEELFLEIEDCRRTRHPQIFVTTCESTVEAPMLETVVTELINLAGKTRSQDSVEKMRFLLPEVCHFIDTGRHAPRPALPQPAVVAQAKSPSSLVPQPSPSGF